ncbi:hypothetical protein GGR51DRAFT_506412 [Nemania sp. FL0031]|nr:hypothetical protein GGR51DRAFT_506412 [Nemania sp. FL0031]
MITSSERADTTTAAAAETNTTGTGYRHIPEVAAAQFSRTTTSTGMQGDKSLVHSLSKAAVRFYAEGASAADRQAIDSSITPGRQRSLLQRTRSQKEQQHGRNQFQAPRLASGDDAPSSAAAAAAAPSRRRGSKSNPGGDATIVEESALADLHLHAFPSQGSDRGVGGGGGGADLHSSEETLVDASTAREHRIDWSQSDEMLPSERKGLKIQIPPLLRRTGSILALKGKLGGHSRRDSGDNNHNNNNNNTSSGSGNSKENNNRLRIVTIQEDCDEEAEAEADDGSTPMSPNSGSPRFGRGLWGRLRRN